MSSTNLYYLSNRQKYIKKYNKQYYIDNKEILHLGRKKPSRRYASSRSRAKSKHIEFDLTRELYLRLVIQNCVYCGICSNNSSGIGLDRIDNSKGYIVGNVLPCCGMCNRIRGWYLTVDEMKVAMKAILYYRANLV